MSRYGQFLREENISLALELLSKAENDFPALRYYSRASMFGRIEMDPLWRDFLPYPERPGPLLTDNVLEYRNLYKSGNYNYLYHFADISGDTFKVLEIKGKKVVSDFNGEQYFQWRNPNLFRFFMKR